MIASSAIELLLLASRALSDIEDVGVELVHRLGGFGVLDDSFIPFRRTGRRPDEKQIERYPKEKVYEHKGPSLARGSSASQLQRIKSTSQTLMCTVCAREVVY
jgi:hypothetical protein